MTSLMPKVLCLTMLIGGSVAVSQATSGRMEPSQRASLRTLHSSELESLRAGAPAILPVLQDNERSALRFAESRSRDLATLRAGLSDREWTLVVVGIAVIILLIAIS